MGPQRYPIGLDSNLDDDAQMIPNLTKSVALLLISICLLGCGDHRKSDVVSVVSTSELAELAGGNVQEIEILGIAEDANTSFSTPDTISDHYHVRLEIRKPALSGAEIRGLIAALRSTTCTSSGDPVDVRTAIVFWGADHKKLKGFYYGSQGHGGQIDHGAPCQLGPGLYKWAQGQLAPALGR